MNKQLIENNYLIVDEFISETRAKELFNFFKSESQKNPQKFVADKQCPNSLAMYNFKPFLELLVEKIPFMSEQLEELMLPTYTYARLYVNNEILKKHTDRPSCEISVTLHLDSDGTEWPIFFTRPNGEVVSCNLKPGQAVIYLGTISEHWRDKFEGKEYGQLFLHYVRSKGENWVCYFDKYQGEW